MPGTWPLGLAEKEMRVLVVDDDSSIRAMLCHLVENSGSSIVGEAGNGQEAIEQVERLHPDMILVDISMPVMSGLGCGRLLNRTQPGLILVFVTQHRDRSYLDETIDCGTELLLSTREMNTRIETWVNPCQKAFGTSCGSKPEVKAL